MDNQMIFLLIAGALGLISILLTRLSSKFELPFLVPFVLIGMALNAYIYFDDVYITTFISNCALIVILFDGGFHMNYNTFKKSLRPAGALATVGVVITAFVIGIFAALILQVDLIIGVLFGAIVSSTDAASVFAVFKGHKINDRLSSILEVESGINDPMAIFLTVACIELITLPETSFVSLALSFFWEMGAGLVGGMVFAKLSAILIEKIHLDDDRGLYPLLALILAVICFAFIALIGGSGFLAVYIFGILLSDNLMFYRKKITSFTDAFSWMMQIILFIILGLFVFPKDLLGVFWQGLLLSLVVMFIARPIGVFGSLIGSKLKRKEKLFISWAGLKGAVPIMLATYPLAAGVPNSNLIFLGVFFVVLTSAIFQGTTLSNLARKLKVEEDDEEDEEL